MKVGLFGGSFNPPHIGHMMACYHILETTDIDKIWLMPCYKHAFSKELIDFSLRVKMCEIGASIFGSKVLVSTIENEFKDKNYTIDTVSYLKKEYPHIEFVLIVGSDLIAEIEKWKDYKKLEKIVEFYVLDRTKKEDSSFIFPNISSTMIRTNVSQNKPIDGLVPKKVVEFIKEMKLFR